MSRPSWLWLWVFSYLGLLISSVAAGTLPPKVIPLSKRIDNPSLLQRSSQCGSLGSFCADFNNICLKACATFPKPHGSSKETPIRYKCDSRGADQYDFSCICDDEDITFQVLNEIATSPPVQQGSTTTKTVTSTKTQTTTIRGTKTQTATRTLTDVEAHGIFTKIVTIHGAETDTVTVTVRSTKTINALNTVFAHATVTDVESSTKLITVSSPSTSPITVAVPYTTTVEVDVSRTTTETILTTAIVTASTAQTVTVSSTSTAHVLSTSVATVVTTDATVFETETDVVGATTTVDLPGPLVTVTYSTGTTLTVLATSTDFVTQSYITTSTTTAPPSGPTNKRDLSNTEFGRRDNSYPFCQTYGSKCTLLCGGRTDDIRSGICGVTNQPDVYELKCVCRSGRDETIPALCAVDNHDGTSGPARTVTLTKTATVKATTTDYIRTVDHTITTTKTEFEPRKTVTSTRTVHDDKTTVTVTRQHGVTTERIATTLTRTLTDFITVDDIVTTTTTEVYGVFPSVTVTQVVTVPSTRTIVDTSFEYGATTVVGTTVVETIPVTIIKQTTVTDVIGATTTLEVTATSPTTVTSTSFTTATSQLPGTTVTTLVVSTSLTTVDTVVTATVTIPYTVLYQVAPTGRIVLSGGGQDGLYLNRDLDGGESVQTTGSEAQALLVTMFRSDNGQGVYILALNPTDTYDGYLDPRFTWLGTDSYYQQGPILGATELSFIPWVPKGPGVYGEQNPAGIRYSVSTYGEDGIWDWDRTSNALSPYWIQTDSSSLACYGNVVYGDVSLLPTYDTSEYTPVFFNFVSE